VNADAGIYHFCLPGKGLIDTLGKDLTEQWLLNYSPIGAQSHLECDKECSHRRIPFGPPTLWAYSGFVIVIWVPSLSPSGSWLSSGAYP
jgi:hypothetical protein